MVNILRSLYKIPTNATVTSMERWKIANDSYYTVVFTMYFAVALPSGDEIKISTYQLKVNPNSFVTVLNSKVDYQGSVDTHEEIKNFTNTTNNESTQRKALSLSLTSLSPYSRSLY